jgi:hypothetical protein
LDIFNLVVEEVVLVRLEQETFKLAKNLVNFQSPVVVEVVEVLVGHSELVETAQIVA